MKSIRIISVVVEEKDADEVLLTTDVENKIEYNVKISESDWGKFSENYGNQLIETFKNKVKQTFV